MFSHRHFEKKGASWWGWGGSDILLVENLLKKQFSILIIIPGHLEKKKVFNFYSSFHFFPYSMMVFPVLTETDFWPSKETSYTQGQLPACSFTG